MGWPLAVVGAAVVVLVLREVFHTLFHPTGQGWVSSVVMRSVWRLAHLAARRGRLPSTAGPVGMALVVLTWGLATALGWTLIYLAGMPDGFSFAPSLAPAERDDLADSIYLSLVTVATLGFGDVVPTSLWLRLVTPLEALIGFVLLTAAVSWILQVYPALTRRRVLALQLASLRRACREGSGLAIDDIPTDVVVGLAVGVAQARTDLTEYEVTYYFPERQADISLPAVVSYAAEIAAQAASSRQPATRLVGAMLADAVDGLARVLDRLFLRVGGDTRAILRAYAEDQGYGPADDR